MSAPKEASARPPFASTRGRSPDFIGRRRSLRSIYHRLASNQSCAVVGPPQIGKSSILSKIGQILREGSTPGSQVCQFFFDCHVLPGTYGPVDFFSRLWPRVLSHFPDGSHLPALRELMQHSMEPWAMHELFAELGQSGRRVVLVLDEFDALLSHPRFYQSEFFGPLRSLSSTTDGLALLTASRLSMAEMNRRSQQINLTGSPFFNNMIEFQLKPFDADEVAEFLVSCALSEEERAFVVQRAGRHPFLLNAAVTAVHETRDNEQYLHDFDLARKLLRERTATYCADQWCQHSPEEQQAMQALVGGRLDSYSEASGAFLRATLHRLAEDGIVEAVGGSYRINAGDFADWLVQSAFHSLPVSLSAPQGSTAATCPTITELRHRLRTTLRLAADFDAFCLDFFPEVKRRFADGMDRTTRENMLLELADLTEVEQSLTGWLRLYTVITR